MASTNSLSNMLFGGRRSSRRSGRRKSKSKNNWDTLPGSQAMKSKSKSYGKDLQKLFKTK